MGAWLLPVIALALLVSACSVAAVGGAPTPTPIVVAPEPVSTPDPNEDTVSLTFRLTLYEEVSKRDGFGVGARSTEGWEWQLAGGKGASLCGKHPDARTELQSCEGHGATYTTTVVFPKGTSVEYGFSRWSLCPKYGDNSTGFGQGNMTLTQDTMLTETFTYDDSGRTYMHYDAVSCAIPGPGTAKQSFRLKLERPSGEGEAFGVRVTGMGPSEGLLLVHCPPLGPCDAGEYEQSGRYPIGSPILIEYLRWPKADPYAALLPNEGEVFARFMRTVEGKATHSATYKTGR